MPVTLQDLLARAATIRDAYMPEENTALRVGSLLVDMIRSMSVLESGLGNIPSLTGYATEQWVKDQKYLTSASALAWSKLTGVPTTLSGYGITDAKISNGTITLGSKSITPLVSADLHSLKFVAGIFDPKTYSPNSADVTVKIPTSTSHISEGDNLFFTDDRAKAALKPTIDSINNTLSLKLDKSTFDELFVPVRDDSGKIIYIEAQYTFVSKGGLQSYGYGASGSGNGGGGSAISLLMNWGDHYDDNYALSAELGVALRKTLIDDYLTADSIASQYLTKADASTLYQPKGNYLTKHQDIYALTIKKNGTKIGDYTPNSAAKTIDITDVASAATLSTHMADDTAHITSAERTKWNKTSTDLSAILGTDSDTIINKWEEVVDFLATYTEADTLAGLLSNKVDKAIKISAGTGLSGGGDLSANRTLSLNAATASALGGVKIGANITITNGVISTHAPYVHPTGGADTTIQAADGRVLSAITVNSLGHVTSVNSKLLKEADIPALSISKITDLKSSLDSKLSIKDFEKLFVKKTDADGGEYIEAQFTLVSVKGIQAFGHGATSGSGSGSGSGAISILSKWSDWAESKSGYALSAGLGNGLKTDITNVANRVTALEGKNYLPYTALNGGLKPIADSGWGNSVGDTVAVWADNSGNCAFKFKKNNPDSGKMSLLIDGTVYINEGYEAVASQSWVLGKNYLTSITKSMVEGVLTGNITSHEHTKYALSTALSNYVTLDTVQTISGAKTFSSSIKTNGQHGTWLSGKSAAAIMFNGLTAIDSSSAWYFYNMKSASGHTIAFGGLGDSIGFYTFLADRTENSYDSYLICNTTSGQWATNKPFTAKAFVKVGGTSSQFLKADGSVDGNSYALASALGNYYTKTEINTKLTDGSVSKVGTVTVGSNIKPVYLNKGVPTECITSFGNNSGQIAWSNGTLCTNLNADLLDGLHLDSVRGYRVNHPAINSALSVGNVPFNAFGMQHGTPMYNDPEFASGVNSVSVYNNAANGNVTIDRIADSQASANSSGYILQIKVTGAAAPGLGGFVQGITSRANAVFMQIFRAKIPVGYNLVTASNSMGSGYSDVWITSTNGTGKWEWYARMVYCGASGSFSGGGHVYLNGATPTASAPLYWYLSHCQLWDLTKNNYGAFRAKFADKLSNSRKLWGQDFDGSGNVSGSLKDVDFITGTTSKGAYLCQSAIPTAVGNLGGAIGVGLASNNYGMFMWGTANGNGHIQVGRNDGNQTAYNLILQEFGGNVGINTSNPQAKLHVNGTLKTDGVVEIQGGVRLIYAANRGYCQLGSSTSKLGTISGWNGEKLTDLIINSATTQVGSTFKIGNITLTAKDGYLEIDSTVVATGDVQAFGASSTSGGSGSGGAAAFNILNSWPSAYNDTYANYAIGAKLGIELNQNKLSKTDAQSLYQPKGNYLTSHQVINHLVSLGRVSTANVTTAADRRMTLMFSSSSMASGKPVDDGFILNFDWDSALHWGAQLYLGHNQNGSMQWRPQGGAAWNAQAWRTILDSTNYLSILDSRYYTESEADAKFAKLAAPNNLVHSSNEITMIPADYNSDLWFNYKAVGGTGTIGTYRMGNGNNGNYANVAAKGFIKNGSSDNYLLLGGGGHKALSDLATASALSSGLAGKVSKAGDTMTGLLHITVNGQTLDLGSRNSSWAHFETTAPSGFYFNKNVAVAGEIYAGSSYNQKVWHQGNDGSGSGLDADLLDGMQLSAILAKFTDGSVTKIGTSTVGGSVRPIYLANGTPTAMITSVGASNLPVWMSGGSITAVSSVGEAFLSWGGKNISGNISPLDCAASALHSANRLAFANAAGITIEYSRNGGSSWTAYPTTDGAKINLVSGNGGNYYIGNASSGITTAYRLRVTLNATNMGVYTAMQKLLLNISSGGASGCKVMFERSMKGSETSFATVGTYDISGWSGWNSIPYNCAFGGAASQTGNVAAIRLTLYISGLHATYNSALQLLDIAVIGSTYWATPSNMAKIGHLYTYDYAKNATFPANVTASTFIGALSGNAATANKWATARSFSISDHSDSQRGTAVNVDGSGNVVLPMPSAAEFSELQIGTLSATNATIANLYATSEEVRNYLRFRNAGTATSYTTLEALANGNLRVNAFNGTSTTAVATFEAASAQLSLFKLYVGTTLSLADGAGVYGDISMIKAGAKLYLDKANDVWVMYDRSLGVIVASHTIVSKGDIQAFKTA